MAYYSDEHDEDDLPVITLPTTSPFTRRISNDDDNDEQDNTENDRSSKLLDNWRTLYETSIHSLQSDDEDQKSFHMDRPPSFEKPPIKIKERPQSPIIQSQINTNTSKSKWEIRPPELLSCMVGPDRQKREITRRYTTNIVFQRSDSQNQEFNSHSEHHRDHPINPIVKQLKQKFDRMTSMNNTQSSSNIPPKLHRVASLTCRGLTANTGERLIQRTRPVLPVRPIPDITFSKPRSVSSVSLNNRTPITNGRAHRDKAGPPISYPKHFYPPPSTTSVVRQLIGSGATLVYDSMTQQRGLNTKRAIINHQRSFEERRDSLINKNSNLTGGHLPADSPYAEIDHGRHSTRNTHESLSGENYYEPILLLTSNDSSEIKSIHVQPESSENESVHLQPEPSHHHITTDETEHENYYPVYDMAQWRDDDDN